MEINRTQKNAFLGDAKNGILSIRKTPDINRGIADCRNTEGAVLLDVRTPQEYREGHIPGSINIPLQQLDKAIDA